MFRVLKGEAYMCVIIYSRQPSKVRDAIIENMARNNPHGLGAMWYEENTLVVDQVLEENPITYYREAAARAESAGSPLGFHFRKRTSGDVSLDNVHPFDAGSTWMMHNGTIQGALPDTAELASDSVNFARLIRRMEKDTGQAVTASVNVLRMLGMAAQGSRLLLAPKTALPGRSMFLVNPGAWQFIGVHAISNLYAWDAHKLTEGRYGTEEAAKTKKKLQQQLRLFT